MKDIGIWAIWLDMNSLLQCTEQGRIQNLVKGGSKFFWLISADSAEWSHVNEVSPYWPGYRAYLRVLEALWFFITKYAFSPFWGTFLYYF